MEGRKTEGAENKGQEEKSVNKRVLYVGLEYMFRYLYFIYYGDLWVIHLFLACINGVEMNLPFSASLAKFASRLLSCFSSYSSFVCLCLSIAESHIPCFHKWCIYESSLFLPVFFSQFAFSWPSICLLLVLNLKDLL